MTTNNQELYKLIKITTHKSFKKHLKALKWHFNDQHKVYLKVNDSRISTTHEYICNLLLKDPQWNKKMMPNNYLMFLLNAEEFRCFLEEEKGLKAKELGKTIMSLVRLTDKFLISHMLLDKLTKKDITDINNDLQKWFNISYKKNNYLFKDYCDFVSYLNKINKIHGTIKTLQEFNVQVEQRTLKKEELSKRYSKRYDEPSLDWI